jgi:hypothetical protein
MKKMLLLSVLFFSLTAAAQGQQRKSSVKKAVPRVVVQAPADPKKRPAVKKKLQKKHTGKPIPKVNLIRFTPPKIVKDSSR